MKAGPHGFFVTDAPSLADRTSIGIGGRAIAGVKVPASADLERLPDFLNSLGGQVRVMGRGSNVLAKDGPLPLVLLSPTSASPARAREESDGRALIWAEAGMTLPALLAYAARHGFSGLEGLAGIPGNLGGAIAMNAGSFGAEIGSLVRSVEIFSPRLGLVEKSADELVFSYRSCDLPEHDGWFLILSASLVLKKDSQEDVWKRMRETYAKKRAGQPLTERSAGCAFKNPAPAAPAGLLLDQAGLRGHRLGGMRFSPVHANFLINEAGGTFAEAEELMALAGEKVLSLFGHALETEVRIWP